MDLKYTKSTDTEHKVTLTPNLISASWSTGAAIAGGEAPFEVRTSFVGSGAKIKVTAKSTGGKTLGKVSSTIKNNVFVSQVAIPADAKIGDEAYFEVDLPGNGVSGESGRIPIVPGIAASNLKWSAAEARRGDILTLTADLAGARDGLDAKIIIYEYDNDGAHDRIVELPAIIKDEKIKVQWEYQYYEDTDEIPTEEELKKYGKKYNPPEYFFVVDVCGQKFGGKQESGLLTFVDFFEVRVVDGDGEPVPDRDYQVTLPDGTVRKGKTDKDGFIRLTDVAPGAAAVDFPIPEDGDEEEEYK